MTGYRMISCRSEEDREATPVTGDYNKYSGGGYELRFKGQIEKLKIKLRKLQENNWIDNRTRALITEFTVYNAQVGIFCMTNPKNIRSISSAS